jgi:hypothetical protein
MVSFQPIHVARPFRELAENDGDLSFVPSSAASRLVVAIAVITEGTRMARLDLRPNCECCDRDLAPTDEAYICTYECTFCSKCTNETLDKVCPNCLGNLERRPVRPPAGPVGGLLKHPPQTKRVLKKDGCVKSNPADAAKIAAQTSSASRASRRLVGTNAAGSGFVTG